MPSDSVLPDPYTKLAGHEPLPGYTLIEPLGRGGFGEVWKCVAPGGLHKAIKFVAAAETGTELNQELAAFEQIKAIRHPFLLTLERVELLDEELVMVMELADGQLQNRFRECTNAGLRGIPRDELLGYLTDASEALDVIGTKYGLQHLDVKPANLFLTAGRVKVGDYGLVSAVGGQPTDEHRGLTPKYVSPEVLRGAPSPQSDQYSLALVYYELLTGSFPYTARNPQHLMIQHISAKPDLSALPECDQATVARALAKDPAERFPNCLEFARALLAADPRSAENPDLAVRRARIERTVAELAPGASRPQDSGSHPLPVDPAASTDRNPQPTSSESTKNFTRTAVAPVTPPGGPLPPLITAGRRSGAQSQPSIHLPQSGLQPVAPQRDDDSHLPLAIEDTSQVKLQSIKTVLTVGQLLGGDRASARLPARDFITQVVQTAAGGDWLPAMPGDLARLPDGTWFTQFPSNVAAAVVPLKLTILAEQLGMTIDCTDPLDVILSKPAPVGLWGSLAGKKRGRIEVSVRMPKAGRLVGEITLTAAVRGSTDTEFLRSSLDVVPTILGAIKRELATVEERRKHLRVATELPVTIYPMHGDGRMNPAVAGWCRDVSSDGVCFVTDAKLARRYAFLAFDDVPATQGLAILVRVLHTRTESNAHAHGCQFRVEL